MRLIAIYIALFSISGALLGQEDTIIFDPIDFGEEKIQFAPNTDLIKHWYWKNYLIPFGKKSILTDTSVSEGYRLIYWGKYFSIVEMIRHDSMYHVTSDSSSWGKIRYQIYRSQDTLQINSEIQYVNQYCNANKEVRKIVDPSDENVEVLDDRDNWAFEYKIGNHYRSLEGIDTSNDLASIYMRLMKIGGLTGYRIYLKDGGYIDY